MADKNETNINENASIVEQNEMQQTNLLETLEKLQKKHLFYQRVSCLLILVFVLSVVSLLPSAFRTLNAAETALNNANTALTNANTAILQAQETLDEVSNLVVDSEEQISAAMEKINAIDIETLNAAIGDLQAVVEPMAKFFGKR